MGGRHWTDDEIATLRQHGSVSNRSTAACQFKLRELGASTPRRKTPCTRWKLEEVLALRRMWLDGKTASEIAALLPGRTRSMVCSKLHNLGLYGAMSREEKSARMSRALRAKYADPSFKAMVVAIITGPRHRAKMLAGRQRWLDQQAEARP